MRLKGQLTYQIIAAPQQELRIKADNGDGHEGEHQLKKNVST